MGRIEADIALESCLFRFWPRKGDGGSLPYPYQKWKYLQIFKQLVQKSAAEIDSGTFSLLHYLNFLFECIIDMVFAAVTSAPK